MLGLNGIAQRFFGSSNERKLRPFYRRVESINALEPSFEAKSSDELRARFVRGSLREPRSGQIDSGGKLTWNAR